VRTARVARLATADAERREWVDVSNLDLIRDGYIPASVMPVTVSR